MDKIEKIKIQFICFSYSFELLFAYYVQSSGHLYEDITKKALKYLLEIYEELLSADKNFQDSAYYELDNKKINIKENIELMKSWSESSRKWIWDDPFESRGMTFLIFFSIRDRILRDFNIKKFPPLAISRDERKYTEEHVSWSGHIPFITELDNIGSIIKNANESLSIIVTGDIRRSQHLLTYSKSNEDYSNRMIEFLSKSRELIEKSFGIFDKFTGDGFLAYFNEAICEKFGIDFLSAFLNFNQEIHEFSNKLFQSWSETISVLPSDSIGLALGADVDQVLYKLIDYHFIAVSEGIVWSTRVASGASANQTIINNRLYERMKINSSLAFKEIIVEPKYGEPIMVKLLEKKNAKKGSK